MVSLQFCQRAERIALDAAAKLLQAAFTLGRVRVDSLQVRFQLRVGVRGRLCHCRSVLLYILYFDAVY